MEKLLKIIVVVGVLLVGVGVFYHYVIFLPGMEQKKIEQVEGEKREEASKAASRQLAYEACKTTSASNYSSNWATACLAVSVAQKNNLQGCLAVPVITTDPNMNRNFCWATYKETDSAPNCSLPKGRAEPIEQEFKDAKQRCFSEAQNGLGSPATVAPSSANQKQKELYDMAVKGIESRHPELDPDSPMFRNDLVQQVLAKKVGYEGQGLSSDVAIVRAAADIMEQK